MSDPVFLQILGAELFEQSLFVFLGVVFLIILMPYVAGYFSSTLQKRYLKTEIIFRLASLLISSFVAVVFVLLYLPLPADWQADQIIPVLVYIASLAAGIIIWKSSYTIGQERAAHNAVDKEDLTRIIIENDIKPAIGDIVNKVANELTSQNSSFEKSFFKLKEFVELETSKDSSFEKNFFQLKKCVESENTHIQNRLTDLCSYTSTIRTDYNSITEEFRKLKKDLQNLPNQFYSELVIQQTKLNEQNIDNFSDVLSPERRLELQAGLMSQRTQSDVFAMIKMTSPHTVEVVCSYNEAEPDIIITNDGKILDVITVKSYTLSVTDKKGMRNTKDKKVTVPFCASMDAKAEVEYAKSHGLEHIHLIAVNVATKRMIFDDLVKFNKTIILRDSKEETMS